MFFGLLFLVQLSLATHDCTSFMLTDSASKLQYGDVTVIRLTRKIEIWKVIFNLHLWSPRRVRNDALMILLRKYPQSVLYYGSKPCISASALRYSVHRSTTHHFNRSSSVSTSTLYVFNSASMAKPIQSNIWRLSWHGYGLVLST